MMDVFRLSQPYQVNLGLFPDSPMFLAAARHHDARARLSFSKWYLWTISMLNSVSEASVRYSGSVMKSTVIGLLILG